MLSSFALTLATPSQVAEKNLRPLGYRVFKDLLRGTLLDNRAVIEHGCWASVPPATALNRTPGSGAETLLELLEWSTLSSFFINRLRIDPGLGFTRMRAAHLEFRAEDSTTSVREACDQRSICRRMECRARRQANSSGTGNP